MNALNRSEQLTEHTSGKLKSCDEMLCSACCDIVFFLGGLG